MRCLVVLPLENLFKTSYPDPDSGGMAMARGWRAERFNRCYPQWDITFNLATAGQKY
jgi:hypothetical protein